MGRVASRVMVDQGFNIHTTFKILSNWSSWLVGFGFNGPLRQYFSLYRAVSQRVGERGERIDESKNVQTTPIRTYCKRNRPLPYCNQNCRTPRHWKFTQHYRSTRPPPQLEWLSSKADLRGSKTNTVKALKFLDTIFKSANQL